MAAETFAELLPRQGCAILGPKAGLRDKFFLVVEGKRPSLRHGKGKTSRQNTPRESKAKQGKAEQAFCFHDQCVQSHSTGELNGIQEAECTE